MLLAAVQELGLAADALRDGRLRQRAPLSTNDAHTLPCHLA